MRKKLIIGIVAGVAVVGGIVTAIICHKRRRDAFRQLFLAEKLIVSCRETNSFLTRNYRRPYCKNSFPLMTNGDLVAIIYCCRYFSIRRANGIVFSHNNAAVYYK